MWIPWWMFALAPLAIGTVMANREKSQGGYFDFSPVIIAAWFVGGLSLTVCLFIGHWL